jgi:hypothetical protein
MAKFKYKQRGQGHLVYYRGEQIGRIHAIKEASGRHSFYLSCDKRKQPRVYRGMDRAADALLLIHRLKRQAKKQRWSLETLIVHAWESKRSASTD